MEHDELADEERRANAALLKAAKRITKGVDIEDVSAKAREWKGSGSRHWISHAALRDLWLAVDRADRAAQEATDAG